MSRVTIEWKDTRSSDGVHSLANSKFFCFHLPQSESACLVTTYFSHTSQTLHSWQISNYCISFCHSSGGQCHSNRYYGNKTWIVIRKKCKMNDLPSGMTETASDTPIFTKCWISAEEILPLLSFNLKIWIPTMSAHSTTLNTISTCPNFFSFCWSFVWFSLGSVRDVEILPTSVCFPVPTTIPLPCP